MPARRLLLHMAWPMMLSMFIQALYNMVDSMFVSWMSGEAFQALALAYPVQMFMIAVCVGTGVGSTRFYPAAWESKTEPGPAPWL